MLMICRHIKQTKQKKGEFSGEYIPRPKALVNDSNQRRRLKGRNTASRWGELLHANSLQGTRSIGLTLHLILITSVLGLYGIQALP